MTQRIALFLVYATIVSGCSTRDESPTADARPRAITIEEMLEIRQTGAPRWAPDGREVAFTWGVGTEIDLWAAQAASADPGQPGAPTLRQIAQLASRGGATLSPDWRQMAFVSKGHVWTMPTTGGRTVRLTAEEGRYSGLNWSPDSTQLAFIRDIRDQTDIAVVSASGGAVKMIAAKPLDENSPIWAPDSKRLAFLRRAEDWASYEIVLANADGTGERSLVKETYERGVEEFSFGGNGHWSPDGTKLVYLSSRNGYNHLWVVSADGGEPRAITSGPYVDYDPSWSPAGDRIVFVSSRAGDREERHIWSVDASGAQPVRLSPDGFCTDPVWSPDGERIAYRRSSATEPPEIVVQDTVAGATTARLTESRPAPEATASFVAPEAVTYPSRDGMQIPAILLRAREKGGPALVYFHGKGGINLKGWDGLPSYAFHQYLVQQGYSILFVNWRGTHVGYGSEFERANYRDYAGGELEDVIAGAEFLKREVGVHPGRIACWGGSYGGYMTMLAITKAPAVFSAGVSLYGVSDWAMFLTESKRRLWRHRLLSKLGDPKQNAPLYERAAAIRHISDARAPLLLVTGLDDDGVVPAQSEKLFDAMRAAGKAVEYVPYTGEGHGFRHTGTLRDLYTRVEAFLRKENVDRARLTE